MAFSQQREGAVLFSAPAAKIVSRDLPVFYNPAMALNRDISVLLVRALRRRRLVIADPLAGTGVRSLRFLKELPRTIKELRVNDCNPLFPALFRRQLKLNRLSAKQVVIGSQDASQFILNGPGLDYIDIDPFGSPNQFLDAACKKIARDGIIAVTATDTGALAGSFPDACRRKYWAAPLRNEFMHETALRILIRKCQLVAMQYDRALVPVFSHASDHYDRVYLHAEKSKSYVKRVMDLHGYLLWCSRCLARMVGSANIAKCNCGSIMHAAGPLWLGPLWNHKLVKQMLLKAEGPSERLLSVIHREAHIDARVVGFVDIHRLCSIMKTPVPKTERILHAFDKQGYHATPTHFSATGIRTDAPLTVIKRIIKR